MKEEQTKDGKVEAKGLPLSVIKENALHIYREMHISLFESTPDESSKEVVRKYLHREWGIWKHNPKKALATFKKLYSGYWPTKEYLYGLEYALEHFDEIHTEAEKLWIRKKNEREVNATRASTSSKVESQLRDGEDSVIN